MPGDVSWILRIYFDPMAWRLLLKVSGGGEELCVKTDLWKPGNSHIVHKILTYLAEHPDSSDTLEGIIQWWLLERRIEHGISTVKEALAELVAKGFVLENKGSDTRTHYRINRHKQGEIQALLRFPFHFRRS